MNFITDTNTPKAYDILTTHKFSPLKIQTPDGHQLARFSPPRQGWTPYDLWQIRQQFPPQWEDTTVLAYLSDTPIGGTQI
ncbi:hypothetical protein MW374_004312 [Vibrio parahaemolyticus]|uniref:Uncharacterized protein n=1 Tax=Vibrio parahaemolyticus TaxID=670 RepID=A0A9Q3UIS8_VIBPH|nr:hypothetical protein [Vibrio parahaemolyticus]EGR7950933.1 hypothetical protein [Vibrio vulnificus]KOO12812.1 hypothetical protein AKJ18_21875 [Vibrio xuii]EGQ8101819.1 hypothetical protein [Vibrio parahaemolyticus]EGQ8550974.1 hypothetical protein [Vibrio parahaemolyticus]EGQ8923921.1 hypothetical protein [Vibrio parahaemolyticus]